MRRRRREKERAVIVSYIVVTLPRPVSGAVLPSGRLEGGGAAAPDFFLVRRRIVVTPEFSDSLIILPGG